MKMLQFKQEEVDKISNFLLRLNGRDFFSSPIFDFYWLRHIDISDRFDVVFEIINLEEDENLYTLYSVHKRVFYKGFEDPDYLEHSNIIVENAKKVRENQIKIPPWGLNILTIDARAGHNQEPVQWLAFLEKFYTPFCPDPRDVKAIVSFVILSLSANLLTMPDIIYERSPFFKNHIIVGYNNHLSDSLGYPLVFCSLDIDSLAQQKLAANEIDSVSDSESIVILPADIIDNQKEEFFLKIDAVAFLRANGCKIDSKLVFDIMFIFNFGDMIFETSTLMPLLYRRLVNNLLYFPFLLPSSEYITKEIRDEYAAIVEQEYIQILYYCLTTEGRKGFMYNSILKGYLKI